MVLRHNTRPTRPSSWEPLSAVHLQELRDVRLEHLQRGHAHGARAHRLERHAECRGVRQDHALADEAHLWLGVGELEFEFARADERLPARLRIAGSSVSVTSPTTSSLRYSVSRLLLMDGGELAL